MMATRAKQHGVTHQSASSSVNHDAVRDEKGMPRVILSLLTNQQYFLSKHLLIKRLVFNSTLTCKKVKQSAQIGRYVKHKV